MDAYTEIPQLPNDLFLIVDEAGIQAPSKRAMKNENVVLGKLMNIRRHKDLQIFFICQEPEDVDRALRRQMDFFFLKPYNLTEVDSKLLQRLYSFIPGGRNPHMCGFYDANEDKGMQLWLPQPRSEEKHKFSKTFSDVDLTAKHSILGNSEGKESDNKVYASFYCHNCGSQWKSNKITVKQKEVEGKTPRQCPRCNSRNWDQPKQQ
jgi:DNA-directed RNA polymerase subunit RPC12/RpoP